MVNLAALVVHPLAVVELQDQWQRAKLFQQSHIRHAQDTVNAQRIPTGFTLFGRRPSRPAPL